MGTVANGHPLSHLQGAASPVSCDHAVFPDCPIFQKREPENLDVYMKNSDLFFIIGKKKNLN